MLIQGFDSKHPHEIPHLLLVFTTSVTMMISTLWNLAKNQIKKDRNIHLDSKTKTRNPDSFLLPDHWTDFLLIGVTWNNPAFSGEVVECDHY